MKKLLLLLVLTLTTTVHAIRDADDAAGFYMVAWPVTMPSVDQIIAAQTCEFYPTDRYPDSMSFDDLRDAYTPQTGCDWAALALAYAQRGTTYGIPEQAVAAYKEAVKANPALPFSINMLGVFWNNVNIVSPPPITDQPIQAMDITFSYYGLGSSVNYDVLLVLDGETYTVVGNVKEEDSMSDNPEVNEYKVDTTLETASLEDFSPGAFANLLPITAPFSDVPCWDNYPDWTVTVTFEDGTRITMFTNDSNVLDSGGPWQTTIDGQTYMQLGADFLLKILDITRALALPFGTTAAMGCGDIRDPLSYVFAEG